MLLFGKSKRIDKKASIYRNILPFVTALNKSEPFFNDNALFGIMTAEIPLKSANSVSCVAISNQNAIKETIFLFNDSFVRKSIPNTLNNLIKWKRTAYNISLF